MLCVSCLRGLLRLDGSPQIKQILNPQIYEEKICGNLYEKIIGEFLQASINRFV